MTLLEVNGLTAFYGDFQALYGISLSVDAGEVVAVIGANGAGKSTLLNTIVGWLRAEPEMVKFDNEPIGGIAPANTGRPGSGVGQTTAPHGRGGERCGRAGQGTHGGSPRPGGSRGC